MKHWPEIIKFLGYRPSPEPNTFVECLLAYRRRHGLSRKALAAVLLVDEGTLWCWEVDQRKPESKRHFNAARRLELM